ncbi:MAG: CBU_0585 family protein [Gammaproteobacteria bacterium]
MFPSKVKKNYTSELDQLLTGFDELHPEKSESQKAEIKKHERIQELRDTKEIAKASS